MERHEAAALLETVAKSLRDNPQQLHFNVTVNVGSITGFTAQNSGGIGFQANNTGGVGFQSSTNIGDVQVKIAQERAKPAIDRQFGELVYQLESAASELRGATPDRGKLRSAAAWLGKEWIPGVISGVAVNALSAFL
jgi:hypothetical protein